MCEVSGRLQRPAQGDALVEWRNNNPKGRPSQTEITGSRSLYWFEHICSIGDGATFKEPGLTVWRLVYNNRRERERENKPSRGERSRYNSNNWWRERGRAQLNNRGECLNRNGCAGWHWSRSNSPILLSTLNFCFKHGGHCFRAAHTCIKQLTYTGRGVVVIVENEVIVESCTLVDVWIDTVVLVMYCVMTGRLTVKVCAGSVWVKVDAESVCVMVDAGRVWVTGEAHKLAGLPKTYHDQNFQDLRVSKTACILKEAVEHDLHTVFFRDR